jgi:hypothetical protein
VFLAAGSLSEVGCEFPGRTWSWRDRWSKWHALLSVILILLGKTDFLIFKNWSGHNGSSALRSCAFLHVARSWAQTLFNGAVAGRITVFLAYQMLFMLPKTALGFSSRTLTKSPFLFLQLLRNHHAGAKASGGSFKANNCSRNSKICSDQ